MRIKHITPICQAVASEREKTWQTNSYHRTLILKRGGNECVLTKISHKFHCHFNAPTLCGGLQSQRWRQRVGGGRGTGRHWSRERVSGARLVCQSPSIPPTMQPYKQTLTDTVTTHTQTHIKYMRIFPRPFVATFWNPQNVVVKRVGAWQPPAALQEDAEDRRAYCEESSGNNKGDQKSPKLTDIHDAFRLPTSTLFSEHRSEAFKGLDFTHLPYTSEWWPRVKAVWVRGYVCKCVGVSLGICAPMCGAHWHWQTTLCESYKKQRSTFQTILCKHHKRTLEY